MAGRDKTLKREKYFPQAIETPPDYLGQGVLLSVGLFFILYNSANPSEVDGAHLN